MTDEQLEELLRKVTPGPWEVVIDDDGNPLSGRPSVQASENLDCGIVHWDGFVQDNWRSARGDKEIHANARLIAMAPDLARKVLEQQAEIARLKTEIERLGRDLNRAKYGEPDFSWSIHNAAMVELQDRAEKAEAALSESQALLAMAFEVAANHCWAKRDLLADAEKKQVEAGLTGRDYYGRRLEAELLSRSIRALTPADAQAALDARINAAKEEGRIAGLRDAAEIARGMNNGWTAKLILRAILAKIKEAE